MSDTLTRILRDKRDEVSERKRRRPMSALVDEARSAPRPRGFCDALRGAVAEGRYGLIAEIKKASPSRGLIRPDFDPPALARAYRQGGATCLSVLTDEKYFQGNDAFLLAVRAAVDLPVLRKDFTIDPYQAVEARVLGADCVLLILAAVDDALARDIEEAALEHDLDLLLEVHDEAEMERALRLRSPLVGVNNRNLKTLAVDLATTERLAGRVPADRLLICESGIRTPDDLARMNRAGASCFLVGEHLMSQPDVTAATRALLTPAGPSARG